MKLLITLLAFINGAFMLVDGIYVMLHGKFIGPEKPGPWAELFYKLNMNVFKLGPFFIAFGIMWLGWIAALWTNQSWAFGAGIILTIGTLWYLPFGTLIAAIVLIILLIARSRIGL